MKMQQIKLILTPYHFEQIHVKGYSLDMLFLLMMVDNGQDVKALCSESPKLTALLQTVLRKGLILEDTNHLTLEGRSIVDFLSTPEKTKMVKAKPKEDDFERWWKAYPGTDTFTHNGKTFTGSRTLRARKEDCRKKLNAILAEGEYTVDQLIAALQLEVTQKKDKSVKEKINKMSFMQNSLTYLNQRTFEPYVELVIEGISTKPSASEPIREVDI